MFRKIRFRWLMPTLLTAAQLALFAIEGVQERGKGTASVPSLAAVHAAGLQEDESVTFQSMQSPRPSPIFVTSAVLNLPALLGGFILAALLHKDEGIAAALGFGALFVPLIWFPIGRWIDGQLAPIRTKKRRLAGSIARWLLRVLSVLGLLTCLFGFNGGWDTSSTIFDVMPLALWCTWYLFCSFWGERRLRRLSAEESGLMTIS